MRKRGPAYPDIEVQLERQDVGTFAILGIVLAEMRLQGVPKAEILGFVEEATAEGYDELLEAVDRWVTLRRPAPERMTNATRAEMIRHLRKALSILDVIDAADDLRRLSWSDADRRAEIRDHLDAALTLVSTDMIGDEVVS